MPGSTTWAFAGQLCSDSVFLRRAYLDVIGTLPTPQEAREFLARTADKRAALIDRLLERDEFADYWAMKWSDLLRVKAEFPINLWPNAAQAYHRWIRTCIRENKPYDQFVREMLTASGSNFREPAVNFYRAMQSREPQAIAQAVALTFMGVRRREDGRRSDWSGMAAFFSQIGYKHTGEWKEEIVFFDRGQAGTQPAAEALSRRRTSRTARRPDWRRTQRPARGLRRLADRRRRIPGLPATSSTASGPGCWGGASSTSRTTSARTIRRAIPSCWPTWRRNWSPPTTT